MKRKTPIMSSHDRLSGHHAPDFTATPEMYGVSRQTLSVLDDAEHSVMTGMETLIKQHPRRAMQVFLQLARVMATVS